jgi:3-hydroxyisobutyryl-CoA hydrolase
LVNKIKEGRPEWQPATLAEVSDDIVNRFFSSQSKYTKGGPKLSIPREIKERALPSFGIYALPSEEEVRKVVQGVPNDSGTSVTFEELVAKFERYQRGKVGVREKLAEVCARKCEVVDNKDGNFVWLRWKS